MNPLQHHCLDVTRRHFLRDCGVGLGKVALAGLLTDLAAARRAGRSRRPMPLAPQAAAFPGEGQTRHPPLHGGRAIAARSLRLQARADKARRQAAAALGHRRPALRLHPAGCRRARAAVQVRQARPERRGALRDAAASGEDRGRHLPHQIRAAPTSSTTPRPRFSSTPASSSRAAPASARGRSTASARRPQDLPAFVVMSTGSGLSGGSALWSSGFLPTIYTGVALPQPGRPDPQCLQPRRHRRRAPARHARPRRRAEPAPRSPPTATPKSPPASPTTKWPSACRPPRRS